MKRTQKINVGVIGLGMGRWHLQNYAKCANANVLAVCDIDETRLKAVQMEYDAPYAYANYAELIAMDELDAVTVALPNYLHAPVTIAALRAGKHVLVEKPMATSAREAEEMVAAAKRAQRILMMHFNYRFTPEHFFLKDYVQSGGLGEVYFAKAFYLRRRGIPALGSWFTQKALSGGGALCDIGVHALDLALWLMDYPQVSDVLGASYAKFGPPLAQKAKKTFDVDDLSVGLIKFENGASLFLEASWASNIAKDEVYVDLYGTKGGLTTRGGAKMFYERAGAQVDAAPVRVRPVETPQQHFVNCIQRGMTPICPGEHGLAVQRILDAIYASSLNA
ncbi:MAG: Gfo/Idh/MocA family oxidoreductase [Abditibacteriales bacterium]|nr:Gfo/Idh/MocA family oxidoreductase [Abditibacteriales bacterium]MDW8367222.1 Gfo/Idh/MocA family oxidoreductase [Abditibacteriales bacterium]